jgi:predicted short-subunit dehydrogenase-like oxidoreductase (DUF2520 family)
VKIQNSTLINQNSLKLGFIGAGRVGTTLALALHHAGYQITVIASRSERSAQALAERVGATAGVPHMVAARAGLVLITTDDATIAPVCQLVATNGGWRADQSVVHCSGALGRTALATAAAQGALTGCLHPLQTFPSAELGLANLPGSFFAIEADEPLRSVLHQIVRDLRGQPLDLSEQDRALYHAAAAIAANYTTALFAVAVRLFGEIGVVPDRAVSALLPLLRGSVESIAREGLPDALTGPISRGDAAIVTSHLHALAAATPDLLQLYRELATVTLPIALARGLAPEAAEAIKRALADPGA